MLKIAIKQMNSTVGDFDDNTLMIIDAMKAAALSNADMLVLPELALCGYYPYDLLCEPDFLEKADRSLSWLLQSSRHHPKLMTVIGTVRENKGDGKSLYNALVVIQNGKIITEYYKQLLPTYNVFDELRHFAPGPAAPCVVDVNGNKVGFIICEDGWSDADNSYGVNPIAMLAQAKPDLMISINASPSNIGKREQRHEIMAAAARTYQLPILYVNSAGGQDSLVFDGSSFAMSAGGNLCFEARLFNDSQEDVYFGSGMFQCGALSLVNAQKKISNEQLFFEQIIMGLRDYARKCNFKKVVIGSSGGIDSALTLALAAEALGAENVTAITMPSVLSSEGSVTDSELLCKNLGVKLITHPIKDLVTQYSNDFSLAFNDSLGGVSLENLQARIRGTILMEYSNSYGALLLSTGNKSEISIGYCTLYGDTNGGLNLIGDLYKTEVYKLSQFINNRADREIIPSDIITKEPSAELAPGQKDTDSLPEYAVLDEILKYLIEGERLSPEEYQSSKAFAANQNIVNPGLVEKIKRMIARNEYKRYQAAPIIRVRSRAFGSGRQMPIAAKY